MSLRGMKRIWDLPLAGLCLSGLALSGQASTLTTANYQIEVTDLCAEGNVTCDSVKYEGPSVDTGRKTVLTGSTLHGLCADGVTPCRFHGYVFRDGSVIYRVFASGLFQVVAEDAEILIEESGSWGW